MVRGKFDSKVESFAQLTGDNRLKIWDVETGAASADYTPEGKLATELTALAWGLGAPSASGSKKKKSKKVAEVVAVGTARGDVLLWDCARNEVQGTLGGEGTQQTARVNDLCFSSSGAQLLVCTEDGQVTSWQVATGAVAWQLSVGKQPAKRLALHGNDDQLATGATTIKLWDLTSKKCQRKLTGHASPVTSLLYSPAHTMLLSSSADRFVNVWDASPDASSTAALRVFTLDAVPTQLSVGPREDAGSEADSSLLLVAVSEAGGAGVWVMEPLTKKQRRKSAAGAANPEPPHCWIGQGGGEGGVWGAALDGEQVRVCRGSELLPRFERVEVVGGDGALVASVALQAVEGGGLLLGKGKEGKKKEGKKEVEVIRGADIPIRGMEVEEEEGARRKRKGQSDVMEVDGAEEGDDVGSLDDDATLEDKVRALGLDLDHRDGAGGALVVGGGERGVVKAESVQVALVQAIDSDDRALLASCLAVTNPRVIEATVARLPPRVVVGLLKKVVAKFQLKPARSVALVAWIRAVLTQHTAVLMSQPDVVKSLTPLYQLVEARVSTYHKLLKLGGRLELALNQVGNKGGGKKEMESKEPELVVDETGGEADDVVGVAEEESEEESEDEDEDEDESEDEEEGGEMMEEDEDEDEDEEDDDEDDEDDEDD